MGVEGEGRMGEGLTRRERQTDKQTDRQTNSADRCRGIQTSG